MPSITHVAKSSLVCLPDCSYALIIRTRRRRVISRLWTAYCPLSTQIPSRPPTAFLSRNSVRGGGGGNLRDVPVVDRWASPKRFSDAARKRGKATPDTFGGAGYASEASTQTSIARRADDRRANLGRQSYGPRPTLDQLSRI